MSNVYYAVRLQPEGLTIILDRKIVLALFIVSGAPVDEGSGKIRRPLARLDYRGAATDSDVWI